MLPNLLHLGLDRSRIGQDRSAMSPASAAVPQKADIAPPTIGGLGYFR
ncbi:MAG: hypothetical protein WCC90_14615 [Methylocella sp.]